VKEQVHMRAQRAGRNAAFSLIEVVIALGLLTVGMLAVGEAIVNSSRLSRESMERAHARSEAEARLSELRTLLHRASWTDASLNSGDAQTVHDTQFGLIITQNGATTTIDLLDDSNGGTTKIPGVMTTYVFATNETAIAAAVANGASGGLGLASVDLDGNGQSTDTSVPVADLMAIGVKVEITWKPGGWKAGDPDEVLRLVGLLY
jgi:type II secretory pathway pseudopilin PulG